MKKLLTAAAVASLCIIGCNDAKTKTDTVSGTDTSFATATTTPTVTETPSAPVDSATMMKNWMAYATPGDMHKMMASWDGKWEGEMTSWSAPGAKPEVSKSSDVSKMIMGGRYQVTNVSGTMMGQPFEGMSTLAYDNAKKVFISTWIDNMGTGLMKMEGPWDATTKSITLTGKMVDPSAGTAKESDYKQIIKIVDDKNQVMEMYAPGPDGKEFKMMEAKYTRK
jgi:hypothetical protein